MDDTARDPAPHPNPAADPRLTRAQVKALRAAAAHYGEIWVAPADWLIEELASVRWNIATKLAAYGLLTPPEPVRNSANTRYPAYRFTLTEAGWLAVRNLRSTPKKWITRISPPSSETPTG